MEFPQLPAEAWASIGLIMFLAVLWVLRAMTDQIRYGVRKHNVNLQAAELRRQFADRLKKHETVEEIEAVDPTAEDQAEDAMDPVKPAGKAAA